MGTQQFCLRWNNHLLNMMDTFGSFLDHESLVDVTLACDGSSIRAHKVILSACSPFFLELFANNPCKHPIVIMKDIAIEDLKAVLDFIYHGETNVCETQLPSLLKCAETLKIKGLAEMSVDSPQMKQFSLNNDKSSAFSSKVPLNPLSKSSYPLSPSCNRRRGRQKFSSLVPIDNDSIIHQESNGSMVSHHSEIGFNRDPNDEMEESVNGDVLDLSEHEKKSLDVLTVDDSQMIVPKNEKDTDSYDEEFLDTTHDTCQFEENFSEMGSSSQIDLLNSSSASTCVNSTTSDNRKNITKSDKTGYTNRRGKRRLWTDSDMQSAVNAVLNGGWTTYAASSQFGIPRRTLRYYIEKVKMS